MRRPISDFAAPPPPSVEETGRGGGGEEGVPPSWQRESLRSSCRAHLAIGRMKG